MVRETVFGDNYLNTTSDDAPPPFYQQTDFPAPFIQLAEFILQQPGALQTSQCNPHLEALRNL